MLVCGRSSGATTLLKPFRPQTSTTFDTKGSDLHLDTQASLTIQKRPPCGALLRYRRRLVSPPTVDSFSPQNSRIAFKPLCTVTCNQFTHLTARVYLKFCMVFFLVSEYLVVYSTSSTTFKCSPQGQIKSTFASFCIVYYYSTALKRLKLGLRSHLGALPLDHRIHC